ncbi:MAG: four helix bundle protein [Candidatus Peribacteraceae bacterium]|nr:four helix bundle protein [Candidatus Peribacteraceae bacterium]
MNHELRIMKNLLTSPAPIRSFTDLNAWREGRKLVIMIYRVTETFPQSELYELTKQLRKAAVSITSNIAEGFSRRSYKEKAQFYSVSLGSVTEVQNQSLIAMDVGYISAQEFQKIAAQSVIVNKLLNGLIRKTKTMIHDS